MVFFDAMHRLSLIELFAVIFRALGIGKILL